MVKLVQTLPFMTQMKSIEIEKGGMIFQAEDASA